VPVKSWALVILNMDDNDNLFLHLDPKECSRRQSQYVPNIDPDHACGCRNRASPGHAATISADYITCGDIAKNLRPTALVQWFLLAIDGRRLK